MQKKPRDQYVQFIRKNDGNGLEFKFTNDGIIVDGDMINPKTVLSHKRESKSDKIITSIPAINEIKFSPNDTLVSNYDAFLAVDTNMKVIKGLNVCITGVIVGEKTNSDGYVGINPSWPFIFYSILSNARRKEILGWKKALHEVIRCKIFDVYNKVGLVVDAHLGDHDIINTNHSGGIGALLGDKFTMIYASSDKAGALSNYLIKKADKLSKSYMDRVKCGDVKFSDSNYFIVNGDFKRKIRKE